MRDLRDGIDRDLSNRDLSPEQRNAIAADAIEEYQKTEIIR